MAADPVKGIPSYLGAALIPVGHHSGHRQLPDQDKVSEFWREHRDSIRDVRWGAQAATVSALPHDRDRTMCAAQNAFAHAPQEQLFERRETPPTHDDLRDALLSGDLEDALGRMSYLNEVLRGLDSVHRQARFREACLRELRLSIIDVGRNDGGKPHGHGGRRIINVQQYDLCAAVSGQICGERGGLYGMFRTVNGYQYFW